MLPKVSQKDDLNNLTINPTEWLLVETLHGLLQPFYYAIMQLQQQSFPSLSAAKLISNSLIFDFKKDLPMIIETKVNEFFDNY